MALDALGRSQQDAPLANFVSYEDTTVGGSSMASLATAISIAWSTRFLSSGQ
jgi:hypothetical protein